MGLLLFNFSNRIAAPCFVHGNGLLENILRNGVLPILRVPRHKFLCGWHWVSKLTHSHSLARHRPKIFANLFCPLSLFKKLQGRAHITFAFILWLIRGHPKYTDGIPLVHQRNCFGPSLPGFFLT